MSQKFSRNALADHYEKARQGHFVISEELIFLQKTLDRSGTQGVPVNKVLESALLALAKQQGVIFHVLEALNEVAVFISDQKSKEKE